MGDLLDMSERNYTAKDEKIDNLRGENKRLRDLLQDIMQEVDTALDKLTEDPANLTDEEADVAFGEAIEALVSAVKLYQKKG